MKKQILSEEFIRMQKLAGIEIQSQDLILEELLLEACIGVYYLKNNLLIENLDESISEKIGRLRDSIRKLKIKPTTGLVASMLKGLKNTLTDSGYQKTIKIIKDYDGPKNLQLIIAYIKKNFETPQEKLDESIFNLFRNKKTGDSNILSKSIISIFAFLIFFNATSKQEFNNAEKNSTKITSVDQNITNTSPNYYGELASEIEVNDNNKEILDKINTEVNTGNNLVTVDDNGNVIKVGFDTGKFEISDVDKVAKEIADEIIKKAGGKKIISLELDVKGKISNTPGDGDDDPIGEDTEGLGEKRLETGKKVADEVKKKLEKEYSGIKVSIKDGGTNINDTGEEVPVDSEKARDNQVTSFGISMETEEGPIPTDSPEPDSPLTYFRKSKDIITENKLLIILGYFLPLITDNKQPSKEFIKSLNLKEGDKFDDNFVDKKLKEITDQYNNPKFVNALPPEKVKEIEKAIQILSWAQKVKKNPGSIGKFLKKLDSKIQIPYNPGSYAYGSGTTQTPVGAGNGEAPSVVTGAGKKSNLAEIRLANIYENLILEAQVSEWESLPDYNGSNAKSNLGELVPLYVYIWGLEDNGAIKYVSGQYKSSWKDFETIYPVIYKKLDDYLPNDETPVTGTDEPLGTTDPKPEEKSGIDSAPLIDTGRDITNIANLNRNSQIAFVLAKTNNKLNLYRQLGIKNIINIPDGEFNNIATKGEYNGKPVTPQAKLLAQNVIRSRKSPNTFINAYAKITGTNRGGNRRKASITTGAKGKSSSAPIKENEISSIDLLEASIDKILADNSRQTTFKQKAFLAKLINVIYYGEEGKDVLDIESSTDDRFKKEYEEIKSPLGSQEKGERYVYFDKLQNKNPDKYDTKVIKNIVSKIPQLSILLNKINTKAELADFILALFLHTNEQGSSLFSDKKIFATNTGKVRSALFGLNNRIPKTLQEILFGEAEETPETPDKNLFDVEKFYKLIDSKPTLLAKLKNIDNIEEFYQLCLRVIFPLLNNSFKTESGVSQLKQAIALAANSSTKYKSILDAKPKPVNEEFCRMQQLAGLI
jgi:hypothetical protein